jgi:exodeoxyribonuclease VII, small subunit
MSTTKKPESFEAAMRRLEEIANLLEDGEAELAKSLELYKEGAELAAYCTQQLKDARQQVNLLSKESYSTTDKEEN